jgi:hypothetical protein
MRVPVSRSELRSGRKTGTDAPRSESFRGAPRVRVARRIGPARFMESRWKHASCAVFVSALLAGFVCLAPLPVRAATTITLAWNPSPDTNVVGYRIYYGVESHDYTQVLDVGNTTTATLTGLEQGATYYFAATAYYESGIESLLSDEVAYSVPLPAAGSYTGLFFAGDRVRQESAGLLAVTVTARGAYSGRIQIGSQRYSFSGRLDNLGRATNVIPRRGAGPLNLDFSVGAGSRADAITGSVSGGAWVALASACLAAFNPRTHPAPYEGRYTLQVSGPGSDPAVPQGISYGFARVNRSGRVHFAGCLADGAKVSQGARLSSDGLWPVYVSLRSGRETLLGWLAFATATNSDLDGTLSWIKAPDFRARFYAAGFTIECPATGSIYTPPAGGAGSLLGLAQASLAFSGGDLSADFSSTLALGPGNRVRHAGGRRLTLRFAPATGLFRGKVADPATGRPLSFGGAVLQSRSAGYGFLLGTSGSSRVVLSP